MTQSYPPPELLSHIEQLPILQRVSEVYKLWHNYLNSIPRISRYTLGAKIDNLFLETIELIVVACYANKEQKYSLTARASSKLDLLKFFLKLAWEMKLLDNKKYLVVSPVLAEVGKMLGGWLKQLKSKEVLAS